jgi:hypothetical protein
MLFIPREELLSMKERERFIFGLIIDVPVVRQLELIPVN